MLHTSTGCSSAAYRRESPGYTQCMAPNCQGMVNNNYVSHAWRAFNCDICTWHRWEEVNPDVHSAYGYVKTIALEKPALPPSGTFCALTVHVQSACRTYTHLMCVYRCTQPPGTPRGEPATQIQYWRSYDASKIISATYTSKWIHSSKINTLASVWTILSTSPSWNPVREPTSFNILQHPSTSFNILPHGTNNVIRLYSEWITHIIRGGSRIL